MMVPVVCSCACQNPQLRITVLSREFMRPLFAQMPPNVDFIAADLKGRHKGVAGLTRLFRELRAMRFDAVAGNLPYIPRAEKENLQREVREHEPEIALFAEGDGSGVIRGAIAGLKEHLKENGTAMFEAGSEQLPFLASFAEELGEFSEKEILPDCFGRARFLFLRKASQTGKSANEADSPTEERKKRTE